MAEATSVMKIRDMMTGMSSVVIIEGVTILSRAAPTSRALPKDAVGSEGSARTITAVGIADGVAGRAKGFGADPSGRVEQARAVPMRGRPKRR
jgi:hypothetical protein